MDGAELSRRSLLQAIGAIIATAATPIDWTEAAAAMEQAHATSLERGDATSSFFTAAEALDVGAVAAPIVPTDDLPGARGSRPFGRRIASGILPRRRSPR